MTMTWWYLTAAGVAAGVYCGIWLEHWARGLYDRALYFKLTGQRAKWEPSARYLGLFATAVGLLTIAALILALVEILVL
jgi:uncharacterized membrane protein